MNNNPFQQLRTYAIQCHYCGLFWEQNVNQRLICQRCNSDMIEIMYGNFEDARAEIPRNRGPPTSTVTSSSGVSNRPPEHHRLLHALQNMPIEIQRELDNRRNARHNTAFIAPNTHNHTLHNMAFIAPNVQYHPVNIVPPARQTYTLVRTANGNLLLSNEANQPPQNVNITPNAEMNLARADPRPQPDPQPTVSSRNSAASSSINQNRSENNRATVNQDNPRIRPRSPVNRSDEPPEKKVCSRSMTTHELNEIERIYRKDLKKDETECGICYEGYSGRRIIRRLKCSHVYHQVCIFPWLKKDSTCPFCRYNLIDKKNNDDDSNDNNNSGPGLSNRN